MPAKNTNDNKWGAKLTTKTEFRKTSALEDGQSIEGTVLAFKESTIPSTGRKVMNLVMQDDSGKRFTLSPSGNVAYAIRDGLFEVGKTYKIQKEGTKKVKGMTSGVFGIYPAKSNATAPQADSSSDDI